MAKTPPTGHKTPDEVAKWLVHRGFALEHESARAFRRAGFVAALGRTYVDPNEHKLRDIDVVAEITPERAPARMYAIVECKARPVGAWVFRESELPWGSDLWSLIATEGLAQYLRKDDVKAAVAFNLPVAPLWNPTAPIPFAIVEAADHADYDASFVAVSQAVRAARGWVARANERLIALPVVVVDTPLFSLRYDEHGESELTPVDWRRIVWPDPGPMGQTAVDVLRRSALAEHAIELRHSLEALAEKLIDLGVPPHSPGQQRTARVY